jgi:outer membrane protein OmpA-like peptidoglycan-associated protein
MNRLTTVNSEGALPFKKSVPQSGNSVKPVSENQPTGTTSELIEDIIFTDNTANLVDNKQNDAIMKIALYMRRNPNAKILVNGYADKTTGTADENIALSKKRAVIVSNSLILKYSIDANRIQVKWFGTGVQPNGSKSAMNRLVRVSTVNM